MCIDILFIAFLYRNTKDTKYKYYQFEIIFICNIIILLLLIYNYLY